MSIRLLEFREFSQRNSDAPSLRESASRGDSGIRERVADYLERAELLSITTEPAYDVLGGENFLIGQYGTRTDGVWVWSTDLSYYVRTYNVLLPAEFIERAAAFDWTPPVVTDARIDAIVEELTTEEEE